MVVGAAESSRRRRVCICCMGRLSGEILEALLEDDGIEVVRLPDAWWDPANGCASVATRALEALRLHRPDVVILGADAPGTEALPDDIPLELLVVADRGRSLHALRLESRTGGAEDVSLDEFVTMVRGIRADS